MPTLGKRNSQKLLAGVEPATGKFAYQHQSEYFNAETYIAFHDEILFPSLYKHNHRVYLIQDNASYHKKPEVYAWFKKNRKRLEVFLLPPYCPEFNCVEQVWRYTRKQSTHNRYFDTVEELCQALFATFDDIQRRPESIFGMVSRFS